MNPIDHPAARLFLIAVFSFSLAVSSPGQEALPTDSIVIGLPKRPAAASLPATAGAVTRLDAGQLNIGFLTDWNQLWQGLVPGLTVVRPGSNPNELFNARIRGLHTLGMRATPLYVLDGVPGVEPWAIDPADITSVEVLRDVASTDLYGGRGAAGVLVGEQRPA